MHKRALKGVFLLFLACLLFLSVSCRRGEAPGQQPGEIKPSVILITFDALRADHLSCYGYGRKTSPFIDSLAMRGVLFSDAVAHSSHTPPSLSTLATSTQVVTHGVATWGDGLPAGLPTVFEIFRSQGYGTFFVTANAGLTEGIPGFDRGLEEGWLHVGDAGALTDQAIKFLAAEPTKPFFLWVHYMDTHQPYIPAAPDDSVFIGDRFYDKERRLPIGPPELNGYSIGAIPYLLARDYRGNSNPDFYVARIDGAIRSVDRQVARLTNFVQNFFRGRRMLIAVTSDHGEMLGEHGYFFHHGEFLFEPLIHVPFILYAPAMLPRGRVVNEQIGVHLDFLPTILDFCGIERPASFEGHSLRGLILDNDPFPSDHVFCDEGASWASVRVRGWKLVVNRLNRETMLFDLRADPGEKRDVSGQEREVVQALMPLLNAYLARQRDKNSDRPSALQSSTVEGLRSLGYLQ